MHAMTVLLPVFGIFIPALILPGPDFVAVVRSSITRGGGGDGAACPHAASNRHSNMDARFCMDIAPALWRAR